MRIFLTGVTGFIAEALVPLLQKRGHELSGLVRYVSTRDRDTVEKMLPDVSIFFGDLTDPDSLKAALSKVKPDVVVNLAAQTSVEYSFQHMREVYAVDFLGTVNLSLAAKECVPNLERFVQISSVETYGNQPFLPLREEMKLCPAAPYGVAKASGEYHLNYLKDTFGFPIVIIRNANSYGRRRNKGFVVERIITELLSGTKTVRMGSPDSQRDFYYVDDEAEFFARAIEVDGAIGETINSGTNDPITIRALFQLVEELMSVKAERIEWGSFSPRAQEIKVLTMDISKADKILRWRPKVPLEEGLQKTIEYWQEQTVMA